MHDMHYKYKYKTRKIFTYIFKSKLILVPSFRIKNYHVRWS